MRSRLALALATAALATQTHAVPAAQQADRAQLDLAGVVDVGGGRATMIVLKDKHGQTILPMLVRGEDGRAAASNLQSRGVPALLQVAMRALGARVDEVELLGAGGEVRSGRARIAQGQRTVEINGRPPELVALAVATGAPLFIDRHLLDAAGLTPRDIERARREMAQGEATWL